jgi:hypothetical protein
MEWLLQRPSENPGKGESFVAVERKEAVGKKSSYGVYF